MGNYAVENFIRERYKKLLINDGDYSIPSSLDTLAPMLLDDKNAIVIITTNPQFNSPPIISEVLGTLPVFYTPEFSQKTLSFLRGHKSQIYLLYEFANFQTLYETATKALRCQHHLPETFGSIFAGISGDGKLMVRSFFAYHALENFCAMLKVEKKAVLNEMRGRLAYVPSALSTTYGKLWRLNLDTKFDLRAYVPLLLMQHPRTVPIFKASNAPLKIFHFYQLRPGYPRLEEMVKAAYQSCGEGYIQTQRTGKLGWIRDSAQWNYIAAAINPDFNATWSTALKQISTDVKYEIPGLILLDLNLSYADDSPIVKLIRQWLEAGINVVVCQPSRSSFPLYANFTSSVSSYAVSPFGGMCKVHSQSGGSVTPLPRTLLLSFDTRRATIPAEEKVLASILLDLIQEGKSDREICQLRSLTASTLRHLKQKYYLRSRFSASKKRTGLKKKIEKMALQVSTAEEIAKTLNTTPEHVKRTIAKMKFKSATVNDFIKK